MWQTLMTIIGLAILGAVTTQIILMMARSGRQAAREWTLAIRHERRAAEARVCAERLRAQARRDADACGMRELLERRCDRAHRPE